MKNKWEEIKETLVEFYNLEDEELSRFSDDDLRLELESLLLKYYEPKIYE